MKIRTLAIAFLLLAAIAAAIVIPQLRREHSDDLYQAGDLWKAGDLYAPNGGHK